MPFFWSIDGPHLHVVRRPSFDSQQDSLSFCQSRAMNTAAGSCRPVDHSLILGREEAETICIMQS